MLGKGYSRTSKLMRKSKSGAIDSASQGGLVVGSGMFGKGWARDGLIFDRAVNRLRRQSAAAGSVVALLTGTRSNVGVRFHIHFFCDDVSCIMYFW